MSYRPFAGYCFSWVGAEKNCPRTQDWDTEILSDSEIDSCEFRAIRTIDGSQCAVFYAGESEGMQRYVAQLAHMCLMVNPLVDLAD